MPLPSNLEAKREALKTEASTQNVDLGNTPTTTPSGEAVTPPVNTPESVPAPSGEVVQISRAEFNKLQAAADSLKTAQERTQVLKDDLQAMERRLTELESGPKGSTNPAPTGPAAAPPATLGTLPEVTLTAEDTKDYEADYIAFLEKLVDSRIAKAINPLLKTLEAKIGEVSTQAENATTTVSKVSQLTYADKVAKGIEPLGKSINELVHSEHWPAFLQSTDDMSGMPYGMIAHKHTADQNVDGMVKVLTAFHKKYFGTVPATSTATGYEGAVPNGTSTRQTPEAAGSNKMLPLSVRKDAHKKYIGGEMEYAEYKRIKDEYDLADAEGRVDYNK